MQTEEWRLEDEREKRKKKEEGKWESEKIAHSKSKSQLHNKFIFKQDLGFIVSQMPCAFYARMICNI